MILKDCTRIYSVDSANLVRWYRVWEEGVEYVCEEWPGEVLEQNTWTEYKMQWKKLHASGEKRGEEE